MVRSKYPELSAEEAVHRLTSTAIDKGAPGRDDEYGYGVLDLVAALTADVPPLKPVQNSAAPTPPGTNPTALPDTGASGGNGISSTVITFTALAALAVGLMVIVLVLYLRRATIERRR